MSACKRLRTPTFRQLGRARVQVPSAASTASLVPLMKWVPWTISQDLRLLMTRQLPMRSTEFIPWDRHSCTTTTPLGENILLVARLRKECTPRQKRVHVWSVNFTLCLAAQWLLLLMRGTSSNQICSSIPWVCVSMQMAPTAPASTAVPASSRSDVSGRVSCQVSNASVQFRLSNPRQRPRRQRPQPQRPRRQRPHIRLVPFFLVVSEETGAPPSQSVSPESVQTTRRFVPTSVTEFGAQDLLSDFGLNAFHEYGGFAVRVGHVR